MSSKICVIVGAGPGLGIAIAQRFGREGYRMALLSRRLETLEEHRKILGDQNIQATSFSAEASDAASLAVAFEQVQKKIGNPDVLIYNTAAFHQGTPMQIAVNDLVHDFKVNVAGALVSAQHVVPGMQEQGQGTILITGGGLALEPAPEVASLALGKAAIRNLTFSLAKELESQNIHVATITICGTIQVDTRFDPNAIADEYWKLHIQEPGNWDREYVYQ